MAGQDHRDERRRAARVEKLQLVQVTQFDQGGMDGEVATGRTLNLSPGGMRLELTQSLPLRALVSLSVALEDTIVELGGRVVYQEVVDDERTAVGIAFTGLSVELRDKITTFLGE